MSIHLEVFFALIHHKEFYAIFNYFPINEHLNHPLYLCKTINYLNGKLPLVPERITRSQAKGKMVRSTLYPRERQMTRNSEGQMLLSRPFKR